MMGDAAVMWLVVMGVVQWGILGGMLYWQGGETQRRVESACVALLAAIGETQASGAARVAATVGKPAKAPGVLLTAMLMDVHEVGTVGTVLVSRPVRTVTFEGQGFTLVRSSAEGLVYRADA